MDSVISVTPNEIINILLLICGGIISIGGALTIVKKWINGIKKPNKLVKQEVEHIEETLNNHEDYFKKDRESIEELKEGQQLIYKSQLALIRHAIDGNNTKQLKEAEVELQTYLITK